MSGAAAYSFHNSARYDAIPRTPRQPEPKRRIQVLPGSKSKTSTSTDLRTVVYSLMAIFICVAAICCGSVYLSSKAISTMVESDALSETIVEQRAYQSDLQVQQSALSNSNNLQVQAAALGMSAPDTVETITLSPDVVATDASGNLSMSLSIKNVVASQA